MAGEKLNVKILVVDDDLDVNRSIVETLSRAGFAVESAPDGEHALALMDSFVPDVLICDLVMPGLDGIEIISRFRASMQALKILAISGGWRINGGPTLENALAAGANASLRKPFGARSLIQTLQALIHDEPDNPDVSSQRIGPV